MDEMKELKGLVKVFLENEEKVQMEKIGSNYMKESKIQEELKNVGIENHLELNYVGGYKFRNCEYCNGPLLVHLKE